MKQWNTLNDGRDIRDFLSDAYQEHQKQLRNNQDYDLAFEDEDLIWALCNWYDTQEGFTEQEYDYINKMWDINKNVLDSIVNN